MGMPRSDLKVLRQKTGKLPFISLKIRKFENFDGLFIEESDDFVFDMF